MNSYAKLKDKVEDLERQLAFYKKKYDETERLAVVVRDSNDAITVQDLRGKITAWNRGAERIYGYTEQEALQMSIFQIIPADKKEETSHFFEMIATGKSIDSFETQRLTKSGTMLDIWLTVTPLFDSTGKITFVATTERDITERKQIEDTLKKRTETVKLFSYSVFHDLKTPVLSIHALTKKLLKNYKEISEEKVEKYCKQIHRSSEHLAYLVEQLNVVISEKETQRTIERVAMQELIKIVQEEFSLRMENRGVKLIVPKNMPTIYADRVSILRIMRNLIDNALKYGGEKLNEVQIGYEENNQCHIFYVRDNGVGLTGEESIDLFQPFKRQKSAKGISGCGLGLVIVKEIAQQHGGKAWIDVSKGEGSTFYFSIAKFLSLSPQLH